MADLPDATPAPVDLDAIGDRYGIPPYRMEELLALRRLGAPDAQLLASLRAPAADGLQPAAPIRLTAAQGRALLAELARLSA